MLCFLDIGSRLVENKLIPSHICNEEFGSCSDGSNLVSRRFISKFMRVV